ncbi:major facilitator superfamily multidrug resistance protein [Actinobaculum suis]|uniref:Major facilitator superfamily multidrug resistance protein n=1 Tax=Actinobaculum suis TaxID=1657 RepID=A0A7Z9C7P3_9ACTO|nr:major facilitator superfamily multidrug resistance protein [Actinobaculum suis]
MICKVGAVKLPRQIWVLVCTAFLIAVGYGVVAPVLPNYAQSFGVSIFAANAVVSVFAFFRLLGAPLSGKVSSTVGERKAYMTGISIVAVSSLACAFAPNYATLLILRGLGGLGSVMFTVAALALIIRYAPAGGRGRASAAYSGAFLIGGIVGPALGALLAPLGMRAPFILYAVALFIASFVVGYATRHGAVTGGAPAGAEDTGDAGSASSVADAGVASAESSGAGGSGADVAGADAADRPRLTLRAAMKYRLFWHCCYTQFVQAWTNLGVRNSLVPLFAASFATGPAWLSGAVLAAFAAGNGVALLFSGRLSDRFGRAPGMVFGLLCAGTFTLGMGWMSWPLLLATAVCAGFGSGFIQPNAQGAIADMVGDREASNVLAAFQAAGDVGQILGPLVAGAITDSFGYGPAFLISGLFTLSAAPLWLRRWRRDKRERGAENTRGQS